jgi:hypothetical protein
VNFVGARQAGLGRSAPSNNPAVGHHSQIGFGESVQVNQATVLTLSLRRCFWKYL